MASWFQNYDFFVPEKVFKMFFDFGIFLNHLVQNTCLIPTIVISFAIHYFNKELLKFLFLLELCRWYIRNRAREIHLFNFQYSMPE